MDQWFLESYLRWLGQASDAELIDRKDAVAIALLQAGIDSELSRVLFDLIIEEVDAREQVAHMRRTRRRNALAHAGRDVRVRACAKPVRSAASPVAARLAKPAGGSGDEEQ